MRGLATPPIRPLRHYELVELGRAEPYYRPRLVYLGAAAKAASDLIERRGLRTALELGPHLRPLIIGADAMDLSVRPALQAEGRVVIHDATVAPWPIGDKAYDLFVALQVFEHLRGNQPEAFLEVRRVARHAILSLPIDWEMANPNDCHHRLSHDRVLGWFAPIRPTAVLPGNGGRRRRLIYVFEDLPAPDPEPSFAAGAARPQEDSSLVGDRAKG